MRVFMSVWEREKERERVIERVRVCMSVCEREKARERERVCACVYECV